jgi:hypothetical protein
MEVIGRHQAHVLWGVGRSMASKTLIREDTKDNGGYWMTSGPCVMGYQGSLASKTLIREEKKDNGEYWRTSGPCFMGCRGVHGL